MGSCSSKHFPNPVVYTTFPKYTGAGILFVGGPVALAGIQKYGRVVQGGKALLSGFGGSKEPTDIDWLDTAWREVLEELFHVSRVPVGLLNQLRMTIAIPAPTYTSGYVLVHLGFDELTKALCLCKKYGITTDLYDTVPLTVTSLVFNRRPLPVAEIGPLALLPVSHRVSIADEFAGDLTAYRT
jgi:hypothetical protein